MQQISVQLLAWKNYLKHFQKAFLIYKTIAQNTTKLNELHELYSGPLTSSPNSYLLEDKINEAQTPQKVENINIMGMATKDWKNYHKKSIYINSDKYNRTMAVYLNESKNTILPAKKAIKIVNENDAEILSKIKFDEPNIIFFKFFRHLHGNGGAAHNEHFFHQAQQCHRRRQHRPAPPG